MTGLKTHIATADQKSITVRGKDLVNELIGQLSFTEMTYFLVRGRAPTKQQTRILDACLVTLMEHGWTPTSIITRLTADSVPGQIQVAIGAGLLAVGDVFAGTMDGCAALLEDLRAHNNDFDSRCDHIISDHRSRGAPIPGFGHRSHKPDDPRTQRLFDVAEQAGAKGTYIDLLRRFGAALDRASNRHITINATGAIAALLLEIEIPPVAMRGMAVVSRAAGLVGHIIEEQQTHAARAIWRQTQEHIPYVDPPDNP